MQILFLQSSSLPLPTTGLPGPLLGIARTQGQSPPHPSSLSPLLLRSRWWPFFNGNKPQSFLPCSQQGSGPSVMGKSQNLLGSAAPASSPAKSTPLDHLEHPGTVEPRKRGAEGCIPRCEDLVEKQEVGSALVLLRPSRPRGGLPGHCLPPETGRN